MRRGEKNKGPIVGETTRGRRREKIRTLGAKVGVVRLKENSGAGKHGLHVTGETALHFDRAAAGEDSGVRGGGGLRARQPLTLRTPALQASGTVSLVYCAPQTPSRAERFLHLRALLLLPETTDSPLVPYNSHRHNGEDDDNAYSDACSDGRILRLAAAASSGGPTGGGHNSRARCGDNRQRLAVEDGVIRWTLPRLRGQVGAAAFDVVKVALLGQQSLIAKRARQIVRGEDKQAEARQLKDGGPKPAQSLRA